MSAQQENKWNDDPRLTAYAFGELEGSDLAEVEELMARDERVRDFVEELRNLGGILEENFAAEPANELTREQRAGIQDQMFAAEKPKGLLIRGRFGWVGAAAAMVLATAFVYKSRYWLFEAPVETAALDQARFTYDLFGAGDSQPASTSEVAHEELTLLRYPLADARAAATRLPSVGRRSRRELQGLGYVGARLEEAERMPLRQETDPLAREGHEDASQEDYARIVENSFLLTSDEPLSTFSIDVDTASYSNVRRMLRDGQLPPADAVRIEEFVNYFRYDYGAPNGEHPFNVNVEVGSAPWAPSHRLVRVGLQAKESLAQDRKASNLVFLMDVSGSMNSADKLPLLKQALHMLVQELDERDTVSIVVYAGASGLALPPTSCSNSVQIHMALEGLSAGGSTNGGAGIELAYKQAAQNFIRGGINRVILATDGDFNVGVSSDGSLVNLIEEKAKSGVFLSVLGFGTGNLKDSKMEQLAGKGNGNYAYIDSVLEARKVLVEEMGSTLEVVAKDVKIQVEFNPTEVQAYRLIGYENRMLAAQDFNDDTKDAGEIGAGHRVTALYEVVPVGVAIDAPSVDPLRYQAQNAPSGEAFEGELLTLKLRYKQPAGEESVLLSTPVSDSNADFQELSADTRWAATVAAFGMLLRGSEFAGTAKIEDVSRWALESAGDDLGGYRAQFIGLVSQARELMQQ
ncbi:MAG: Ca-activated chloride channel family protein [Candidatus Paceibacteria bacterium]|jgi:Ca-activated chloride channel family protein